MKTSNRCTAFLFLLLFTAGLARAAELQLPFVFSDDMILQRDMADPIWGQATVGNRITVKFGGQNRSATADENGHWMLKLDAMPASSEARELTVTDGNQTVSFKDVLVGEIWLCSGQSNMEKPIGKQQGQQPTVNADAEIAAADHPLMRLLTVPKVPSADRIKTNWEICTPVTIAKERFTAAGYFFGRKIQQDLNVPVGLIHSSWGGTKIEPWIAPEGFDLVPAARESSPPTTGPTTRNGERFTSHLYQAMIKPLAPFAMRGAIWYQGESNVGNRDLYFQKMKALIGGWRAVWGEGDFPFYYVQLAPYAYTAKKPDANRAMELPEIWEAQLKSLLIPHTGMAVITDLVTDLHDIHPAHKKEVGERLALWALANDYGRKDLEFSGPLFKSVSIAGNQAIVHFDHSAGLKTRDGKSPDYFEIAGPDGKFAAADAKISGETVVLTSAEVPSPAMVRFGWTETAEPNLENGADLPASPFKSN